MKTKILVLLLFYTHIVGCADKAKKEIVANVVADTTIAGYDSMSHQEAVCDFNLVSIEILQPNLDEQKIKMGTEKPSYSTITKYLTVWVDNNSDIPLTIGRNWSVECWGGKKWSAAKMKKDLFWTDDERGSKETHIRYYFKYPIGEYYILEQGKYRITKTFSQERKLIKLYASFDVK